MKYLQQSKRLKSQAETVMAHDSQSDIALAHLLLVMDGQLCETILCCRIGFQIPNIFKSIIDIAQHGVQPGSINFVCFQPQLPSQSTEVMISCSNTL